MRPVRGGNLSYARVGHTRALYPREVVPFAYVVTGERLVDVHESDLRYTPAERAMKRARRPLVTFPGYPIRIKEDVMFLGTNFTQAEPHTEIFDVSPGVRVCFGNPAPASREEAAQQHCNLTNVSVPDGAEIYGNNLLQGFEEPTGHPFRPTIRTLCACEKCCVVRPVIQEVIAFGNPGAMRDEFGRWLHHDLKPHYRARREDPELMAQHQEQILTENVEAIAWLDPRQFPVDLVNEDGEKYRAYVAPNEFDEVEVDGDGNLIKGTLVEVVA